MTHLSGQTIGFFSANIVDAKYEILSELGFGGFGAVLKVKRVSDDRLFALKYLLAVDDDSAVKRFSREARLMKQLQHSNVMPVVDSNLNHFPPYLVMPLAENSLQEEIGELRSEEAIRVFLSVCRGIQAIHNASGAHRDIKPANILRMPNDHIVVSDMGLARLMPSESTTITASADVVGTLAYIAPEQYGKHANALSDIYSLGKVLYVMLTGETPHLVDPSRVPNGFGHIVEKATQMVPDRRYASVARLMDAVNDVGAALGTGNSNTSHFGALVEKASKMAEEGTYDTKNLARMLVVLNALSNSMDNSEFTAAFELLPANVVQVLAELFSDELQPAVMRYVAAMEAEAPDRNFSYAEVVARSLAPVFRYGTITELRLEALRAILSAAVNLNRYAAMEVFDRLLIQIEDNNLAVAVAGMLRENSELYGTVVDRVPVHKLPNAVAKFAKQLINDDQYPF